MRRLQLLQIMDLSPPALRAVNHLCGRIYFQAEFCRDLILRAAGPNPNNLDLVNTTQFHFYQRILHYYFSAIYIGMHF